ncbi:MAG: hypothetical protein KatS3mg110_0740 [Pirellulaceae bacterium]|nr:MAG: hypothetical protein KatS3mg110_0740 [Pirellulaceae bacterium]
MSDAARIEAGRNARQLVAGLLRIAVPLAIIVWLVWRARPEWGAMLERRLDWPWIAGGFGCSFVALCLSFYRWYLLVRCVGLPFGVWDAFRLGFLGYLLNFVSVGSVGGDLFKAVFIAREHPGRRTLAILTIVADRVVGIYGLLLLTSVVVSLLGDKLVTTELQVVRQVVWGVLIAATAGAVIALWPGFTNSPWWEWVASWPKVGALFGRLIEALRSYRRRLDILAVTAGMSTFGHLLNVTAFFMMARGLTPQAPGLDDHFLIVPLASVAGALPFTPAGLGTFEVAVELLYRIIPEQPTVPGVLVALVYRMITIGMATLGVLVYWISQRKKVLPTAGHSPPDTDRAAKAPGCQLISPDRVSLP